MKISITDRGLRHLWLLVAAVVVGAALGSMGCGGGDDGPLFEAADSTGPDPFTESIAEPAPIEFVAVDEAISDVVESVEQSSGASSETTSPPQRGGISSETVELQKARVDAAIAVAREADLSVIEPASAVGVGLYGGSGVNACSKTLLLRFLAENPKMAEVWASVHGIQRTELKDFVEDLTAGWLLTDTLVINHGFRDGQATPRLSTLEAGTAVLVDSAGIPRVRCKCGNPLREPLVEVSGEWIDARAFADEVVAFRIGETVEGGQRDATNALGVPDCENSSFCSPETALSLGTARRQCEFSVTLRFVDNVLVNGEGDDLRVVELGALEPTEVFVSWQGAFVRIGRIEGGDAIIDLSPILPQGAEVTEVRLCDAVDVDTSASPGADVDAVAALNWRPS